MKQKKQSFCDTEYGTLKQVAVCKPVHLAIREVINETQKKYEKEGLDVELAMKQHEDFTKEMETHGIDVVHLEPKEHFPEQVFTRDIGFTLGQTIFVAEMAQKVRQGEEDHLKDWLKKTKVSYYNLLGDKIEGGDVIIDGQNIYIGVSDRTNERAIEHLQSLLPQYAVTSIPFPHKYLHLDCIFNVLSPSDAIIYPGAMNEFDEEMITSRYDCICVSSEEQFTLGTNVLSIGNKKVFSLPINKDVNKQLRERGYEVIEVDISEIIKSGGSFRCCTMPILRSQA
ncbi:dimethylarginine dimethylaminohydrolase family protein [Alteribacter aurantiacus]|uniref:dimethylarginine dimethylaminohydrolase family protein n=1 Tax=Alteribacter aurantiacus TaxID=254410 RepID=UPI000425A42E|nr:dimethylarginine dimethylaminohydrolase family protein [Alteribacter aurantiacus]